MHRSQLKGRSILEGKRVWMLAPMPEKAFTVGLQALPLATSMLLGNKRDRLKV